MAGEPVYAAARRIAAARGRSFAAATLFGWFAQGADVDVAVTPKPHYGSDGSKAFGITGRPSDLCARPRSATSGRFRSRRSGGRARASPRRAGSPTRRRRCCGRGNPTSRSSTSRTSTTTSSAWGPTIPATPARVAEVDAAAKIVIDAAHAIGAEVTAFSEYGITAVSRFEAPNRALRRAGLLAVRDGPFGEMLETFESRAFAVCDHQVAHVVAKDAHARARAREVLEALPGVDRVLEGAARGEIGLDHPRAGDLVALSRPDAWFAYPYWLDDRRAPDFARTVDIHRKPGYDPCELFVDPAIAFPAVRMARRLAAKKLGFRYRMDVVPLDPGLVRGSHGLAAREPGDGPVLVSEDPRAAEAVTSLADLKAHALARLGLA